MMEYPARQKLKRLYSQATLEDGDNDQDPRKHIVMAPMAPMAPAQGRGEIEFYPDPSPENSKDWRELVREALQLPEHVPDPDLEAALQTSIVVRRPPPPPPPPAAPSFGILHRVLCSRLNVAASAMYLDEPMPVGSDDSDVKHLAGRTEIRDIRRFADRTPGLCFIAIREYPCCVSGSVPNPLGQHTVMGESIYVVADLLSIGITMLEQAAAAPGVPLNWPEVVVHSEVRNLQYWLFAHMNELATFVENQDGDLRDTMACFEHYILKTKLEEFEQVTKLHEKGMTTREGLRYLLIPGTIVVLPSEEDKDLDQCMRLKEWPDFSFEQLSKVQRSRNIGSVRSVSDKDHNSGPEWAIGLKLTALRYDGITSTFKTQLHKGHVAFPWSRDGKGQAEITSLRVYPFSYALASRKEELANRGTMFWDCRSIKHIQYSGLDMTQLHHFSSARFIIDPLSWAQFCQVRNKSTDSVQPADVAEPLECLEPPESSDPITLAEIRKEFFARLPPVLHGFDLQTKTWRELATARCAPVQWDETAFTSLVLDGDTKDVVKALVTNKVTNTVSTDLIRGKGSGLILLFHGPPGTGKTLTAESVAEEARKPLYRVTCGDIGTAPQVVEATLVGILRLCKRWDCVVLLDEAEVFLQERSLTDLNRNALVSVFLRTLEYYDGIMILTSNRVGTFDEGFKSRIQLSLHYPKLTQTSRRKVWQNFFDRLDNDPIASAELDIEDLRKHALALSRFELNGREIRNAINVARPLAISEGKLLDFGCLEKVIKVQRDFDRYLKEMNEGLGDEELAREEGRR